jgi:uncharacterized protein YegL
MKGSISSVTDISNKEINMRPIGMSNRVLPVFYVLDTSGSMRGEPIEVLNAAMEETIRSLRDLAQHNGDANVRIAVLSFDSSVRWMQPAGPEDLEDFVWRPLVAVPGGHTSIGAAVRELNSKLNAHEFLRSTTGSLLPVIIFMTDGYATDDYAIELSLAMQNANFRNAVRVGFAVGSSCDLTMLENLVGDSKAVVQTDQLDQFEALIRFVSETATSMASVTRAVSSKDLAAEIVEQGRLRAGDEDITVTVVPEDVRRGKRPMWDMSDPL